MENMEKKLEKLTEMFPHIIKSYHSVSSSLTKDMDVTFNQFKTILYINYAGNSTLSKLSSALNMAGSTASEIVDRMVKQKYLNRQLDEKNRRQVIITLGAKGKKVISDFQRMGRKHFEKIFSMLNSKNRDKFFRAYEMLYEVTREIDEKVKDK